MDHDLASVFKVLCTFQDIYIEVSINLLPVPPKEGGEMGRGSHVQIIERDFCKLKFCLVLMVSSSDLLLQWLHRTA